MSAVRPPGFSPPFPIVLPETCACRFRSLDYYDDNEEWAWNFIVDGQSWCVTANTDNNMPWEQQLNWQADVTTQLSQLTLKIDAWEKDAPGEWCVWANGDDPSQRVKSEINFPPMNPGQVLAWTQTMTFPNRDMPSDAYCRTTVGGYVTKLASTTVSVTNSCQFVLFPSSMVRAFSRTQDVVGEQQDGVPRITAATVTLVNGVPQLSITGKELNPDSQELPVVQVTGGGSSECIARSIRASGTRHDHSRREVLNTLA